MFAKNNIVMYKLMFVMIWVMHRQAVKLELLKVYDYLRFVPLDGSGEVDLLTDDSQYFLEREAIESDSYHQTIIYKPPQAGIVYYQEPDDFKIYYDFISSEFPLVYYVNSDSEDDLEENIGYADFINDENYSMNMDSFDKIKEYFMSFDFNGENKDEKAYLEKGNSHEFHVFEADDETTLDYSDITTEFANAFWLSATTEAGNVSAEYIKVDTYANFYKTALFRGMNKLNVILTKKLTEQDDLEAWNKTYTQLLSDVESVMETIESLCEEVEEEDDLEEEKNDLAGFLSEEDDQIFYKYYTEYLHLLALKLPLPAALYYKAKYQGYLFNPDDIADDLIERANDRLSGSNWDNHYFVNMVSQLNFDLLDLIFTDVNQGWRDSALFDTLESLYHKLVSILVKPIRQMEQLLATKYQVEDNQLDGFSFQLYFKNVLVNSHPNFVQFYAKFASRVSTLINQFYDENPDLIAKYKQNAGETNEDGKGKKAFTFQFYRMGLNGGNPNLPLETVELDEDFFNLVDGERRRLLMI